MIEYLECAGKSREYQVPSDEHRGRNARRELLELVSFGETIPDLVANASTLQERGSLELLQYERYIALGVTDELQLGR